MPVYAALAEKSAIHDARSAFEAAVSCGGRLKAKLWEDASHSLPMEYPRELDREILDFMRSAE